MSRSGSPWIWTLFSPVVVLHRRVGGDADFDHAGERVKLSFHRSIERLDLGCLVAGRLGIDVNDVPVFGLEMHVCVLQFAEALSKKSCTDKENKRECGLEDYEGALQERCARSRGARSSTQSFSGLRLGGDPCRGNSKENAGHQGKSERKRDDEQRGSGIDRDILRTGKGQRQEHLRPAVSDDEARKSPKDRQRHAFRQELSDNAAALGAERAVRTDISARRFIPRTSRRLAMLAHATRSTRAAIHVNR